MLPDDLRTVDIDLLPGAAVDPSQGTLRTGPETTGRLVVTFAEGTTPDDHSKLLQSAGLSNVANSRDFAGQAMGIRETEGSDAALFVELGVAVVNSPTLGMNTMQATAEGAILAIEPEYVHHILELSEKDDYLRGYRDGVTDLTERMLVTGKQTATLAGAALAFHDNDQFTWGLQATGAATSGPDGTGVKVAVLDTGFTFRHPDFAGRAITSQSFVSGSVTADDGHGHGTHCVGTSCGPKIAASGVRRYGCAPGAEILIGKVLSDQGSGTDLNILAGMNWALANHATVISMSLGADVPQISTAYETVGRRALNRGCLIVAAAGNNAQRDRQRFGFVGIPANSPSIMAVAAVDEQLGIAVFSARSLPGVQGGNVDVAAPGVNIFSAWNQPQPEQGNHEYRIISGTSMATPHVAGIAALWSQAKGRTGRDLWTTLIQRAERVQQPSVDVGSGLVQSPH